MAIEIYDDVFDSNYTKIVWGFVRRSMFQLGWEDDEIPEHGSYINMHSTYNDDDINRLGIITKLLETPIAKYLDGTNPFKTIVNLSSPGQTFFDHTHPSDWTEPYANNRSPKVLLYYPNLEWRREWGGETIFYTMNNKEIERAVEYRPNRLIVFDGEQPHRVGAPTAHAPYFRFSLSLFFRKIESCLEI